MDFMITIRRSQHCKRKQTVENITEVDNDNALLKNLKKPTQLMICLMVTSSVTTRKTKTYASLDRFELFIMTKEVANASRNWMIRFDHCTKRKRVRKNWDDRYRHRLRLRCSNMRWSTGGRNWLTASLCCWQMGQRFAMFFSSNNERLKKNILHRIDYRKRLKLS